MGRERRKREIKKFKSIHIDTEKGTVHKNHLINIFDRKGLETL